MAVAIRGTTPATTGTAADPISLTLDSTRQPNTDDVLLIIHSNDFYDISNMTTPTVGGSSTGVVAVTGGTADNGATDGHCKAYTYVVGSTGDLTVAVDESGSADEEKALMVYVLSGVDTTTPVDVAGNATTAGGNSLACPSISPTSADAFLVCHGNSGPANTVPFTSPGSMTEQYDFAVNGSACSNVGATEQLSASGATGTRTFTAGSAANWTMLSIAMKTAAAGGGPELMPRAVIVAG